MKGPYEGKEKNILQSISLKMDLLDSLIDFLRTFIMKVEEVNENDKNTMFFIIHCLNTGRMN